MLLNPCRLSLNGTPTNLLNSMAPSRMIDKDIGQYSETWKPNSTLLHPTGKKIKFMKLLVNMHGEIQGSKVDPRVFGCNLMHITVQILKESEKADHSYFSAQTWLLTQVLI